MKKIKLSRGFSAIVDDEDYERIAMYNWSIKPQGNGYAVRKGNKQKGEPRTVHMHREILYAPKGIQVDHINLNSLDNRKSNLRCVNAQKNAFNRKKPNVICTSKYKGVLQRKGSSSWTARIKYNDRHIELGCYSSEEMAAAVYNFASRIFFGEFRRENIDGRIPCITKSQQYKIYIRCKRYIEKYGWYVNTETYCLFSCHDIENTRRHS